MAICDVMPHLKLRHMKIANDHLVDAGSWRMAERSNARHRRLRDHPADIEATLILGLAIAASGEAARAAPLLERVRRARPDRPRSVPRLRDHGAAHTGVALVTRQYRASLRLAPANAAAAPADFARYLLEKGESDAALVVLRDATESAGDLLRCAAWRWPRRAGFKEAARCFDSSSRLNPDAAGGLVRHRQMMMRVEGRFDEALVAYSRAISRDLSDPQDTGRPRACICCTREAGDEGWRGA